ncbi:MAG: TetR/AcrR family transcriptional regulator [Clostridia bacterium]|nr:TetR/AcrR family transcriptional regulator [Clostridia bacterium]
MLNSIVGRNRLISPLNETEKKIIRSATKLFLQNGFSRTTLKMISADCGMLQGTIAYHFHTKEDMLYMLIQELLDFHQDVINSSKNESKNNLIAYALEIAAQISLCENDEKAKDLYYHMYILPGTFELVKDWTAQKNYNLLGDRLPDWTPRDFRLRENVASMIEFSAIISPCGVFTLEEKIALILDSLFKLYEIEKEERKQVIEYILKLDYKNIGKNMFEQFINRLDTSNS